MNKYNLEYQGVSFDDMKREVLRRIHAMKIDDAYDLQEVVQEVMGCDVFWNDEQQLFYRDAEAYLVG